MFFPYFYLYLVTRFGNCLLPGNFQFLEFCIYFDPPKELSVFVCLVMPEKEGLQKETN